MPQALREVLYEVHTWLAYATLPLIVGHVVLSTLVPQTREALGGMVRGWVTRDWARAHHGAWLAAEEGQEA